ncbi:hypothetical protein JTB14_003813 [Gonioctena quinquepunctata]|nr:hypothetical protein JTB14_003813 [Gonioctena quinquepunctata]
MWINPVPVVSHCTFNVNSQYPRQMYLPPEMENTGRPWASCYVLQLTAADELDAGIVAGGYYWSATSLLVGDISNLTQEFVFLVSVETDGRSAQN